MEPSASVELPARTALTDRVYELLRNRIIDLVLEPGARLNADKLAADMDVSPTPVREALNRLAAEGLVTAAPYRGFRVSPLLSRSDLAQLLRARQVIECAAVEQAASKRGKLELQELSALVARMDELTRAKPLDVKAFNSADAAFHRLAVGASGNRFLLQALESLHVHIQLARHYQGRSVTEAKRANAEHRVLVQALTDGDGAGACQAARDHLDGVLDRLQTHLDTHDGGRAHDAEEGTTR
ncbi:FCD domain-containing protein [Blastococcus jejuensis]|uniref:FCD domain-containing protein n=1 Tax=Blastococcus jejuensis TaxID=351224 RepID=A0ABP6NWL7_9ACTN